MPFLIPVLVISLKVTRFLSLRSRSSSVDRCQDIASPSRSGSVARMTLSLLATSFFSSLTSFSFPFITAYFGVKPFLTSTLSFAAGRSRT